MEQGFRQLCVRPPADGRGVKRRRSHLLPTAQPAPGSWSAARAAGGAVPPSFDVLHFFYESCGGHVVDATGRVLHASQRYSQLAGQPGASLVGSRLQDLVHEEDRSSVQSELNMMLAAPRAEHTLFYRLMTAMVQSGARWSFIVVLARHYHGDPLQADGPPCYVCMVFYDGSRLPTRIDVAEDAQTAQSAGADGGSDRPREHVFLVRFTCDGNYEEVSPQVTFVLGYEPEELRGRWGYDFIHPDDVMRANSAHQQLLSSPTTTTTLLLRLQRKDGKYVLIECQSRATLDPMTQLARNIVSVMRVLRYPDGEPQPPTACLTPMAAFPAANEPHP